MNEQNYTSLKLSKWLYNNKCNLDNDYYWVENHNKEWNICYREYIQLQDNYPAYDILNDICCRYAKEFFGEELYDSEITGEKYFQYSWSFHSETILSLLQQNKKQEAEEYIMEHCKFNPKIK